MKSIDELREYVNRVNLGGISKAELHSWGMELADEIEREIADRYMELPLDADGVPIHLGDKMNEGKVAKLVIADDGEHSVYVYKLPNVLHEFYSYEVARKPRTLEDVLEEFADLPERIDRIAATKRYAAEIRELLGGDA